MGTSPRWRSRRRLHGRPVAVLPYPEARTCVISANAAAKRHGVGTGTGVDEARRRCPGIALVSQRPDLYVRRAGTETVSALWAARPRALRAVWGSSGRPGRPGPGA